MPRRTRADESGQLGERAVTVSPVMLRRRVVYLTLRVKFIASVAHCY